MQAQWQTEKQPPAKKAEGFDPASMQWSKMTWIEHLEPAQKSRSVHKSVVEAQLLTKKTRRDALREIWFDVGDTPGRKAPQSRDKMLAYLAAELPALNHSTDLLTVRQDRDKLGMTHHFLQQQFDGLPVFGGQLILHQSDQGFLRMNGRLYVMPAEIPNRTIGKTSALELVENEIRTQTKIMDAESLVMKVLRSGNSEIEVLYFDEEHVLHRAWHIKYIPNIYENWEYIIDASTGVVLSKWNNVCQLHNHSATETVHADMPPLVGSGVDLNGTNLEVRCFEENGTFFLLDASREMFQSLGNADMPPQGAILTYDTKNQPLDDDTGFYPNELISSNSSDGWDAKSVSAHFNAGFAYEYFRQILKRNSINGTGGSIYSFINVVDPESGDDFDQAFWNEKIMFYGNGRRAFSKPLQAALDVSAHEMSHGVVQNSANLIYQGESGAINEAVADFFGVGTEARRTGTLDWRIANGVVSTSVYRSGALRDLSDPHNGGSSFSDLGYQPQFYNERFTGSEDNGGVHSNSGIANHAFYLITTALDLDRAEQIVYRSLTTYLTRSSNFQDLRNAMVASASDLHGNGAEVQAVNDAFDFVGIVEGAGAEEPMEAEANPGSDFLLATSTVLDQTDFYQLQSTGQFAEIRAALIDKAIISPPSVTDDGTVIIFVTDENEMEFITIDHDAGTFGTGSVSEQSIWRNAVISRDGGRIAALTTENDNMVWVFDLVSGGSKQFELTNPTFTEGVSTGNVEFADAMDFDFSGELLMYDASNLISSTNEEQYSYWDIGFIKVYDNESDDFSDGSIFKLVSGLPDNVSIGNPVFSKNSPNIIAIDYIETSSTGATEYSILGVNVETGDAELIHEITEEGGTLGYPTFSRSDGVLLFNARSQDASGESISVIKATFLSESKIGSDPDRESFVLLENHQWPVWFANGERMLTSTFTPVSSELNFEFYPNPVTDQALIDVNVTNRSDLHLRVTDLLGRVLMQKTWPTQFGNLTLPIDGLEEMPAGVYLAELIVAEERIGFKILKR